MQARRAKPLTPIRRSIAATKSCSSLSLNQKKYSETSQLLNALKKQFPKTVPNVANDPEYSGFAKSCAREAVDQATKARHVNEGLTGKPAEIAPIGAGLYNRLIGTEGRLPRR